MWYIYKTVNLLNNKIYIGQRKLRKNKTPYNDGYMGSGSYIKKSFLKYGIENFSKEVLKEGIKCHTAANLYEIIFIKKYDTMIPNGYNLTIGGDTIMGYHHTEETKLKMSAALKGKKKSIEHTLKNSESHKGQKMSEESKEKMSKRLKGVLKGPLSDETKEKISKTLTGTKLSNDRKEKIRKGCTGRIFSVETKEKMSKASKIAGFYK